MKYLFYSILVGCMLLPALLWAEEPSDNDDFIVKEEKETSDKTIKMKTTVLITATRRERAVMDTPVPGDVISRDDIDRQAPVSTGELLRNRPGLNLSHSGMGVSRPMIRGLYDARVLILVDGIKLSEQRPGGNHALSIDPSMVERVEIVRGPSSVMYGSDALGGVINFITRKPDEKIQDTPWLDGSVETAYDSATNGKMLTTHVNGGMKGFNIHMGGSRKDTDNVNTPNGKLHFSQHDSWNYSGGMGYSFDKSSLTANYLGSYADIGVPVGNPQKFKKFQFEGERHDMVMATWKAWEMSDWWTDLKVQAAYQSHKRRMRKVKVNDVKAGINLDFDTWSLNTQTTVEPSKSHRITTGLQGNYEQEDTENPYTGATAVAPPSNRLSAGAFIQDEIMLGKRTDLILGARYDRFRSQTDGADDHEITDPVTRYTGSASASAGILYRFIPDKLHGSFNLGRAFRSPTLHELFFRGPHQDTYDIGNPDLEPEYSYNTDVSIKASFSRFRGQISGFVNYIDQYIDKQFTGDIHSGSGLEEAEFTNIGQAMLYGGEADGELTLIGGLSIFTIINYVRGKNLSDNVNLFSMPPLNGVYGLRYHSDEKRSVGWWSEAGVRWAARQWAPGENPDTGAEEDDTPGWQVVDVSAGIQYEERVKITAYVKNLFDLAYHDHLSRINETNSPEVDGKEQPGRSFGIMAKYIF